MSYRKVVFCGDGELYFLEGWEKLGVIGKVFWLVVFLGVMGLVVGVSSCCEVFVWFF